ncbi:chromate transporter [Clostridium sp. DSM 8431]|uniref:chromate transporter n=1 Tax=Clostridium sp. DSM 8431 TaxID=1761781 RepID=UPI0008E3B21A|nr:chromate transporter [Clostridium sp. DSM 8431]SFU30264.1 chromate transporter [Clostridium sp. DSM 8431]
MKIYIQLFLTFFKIGAFSFGGGYAMIPFIQREVIDKHNWINLSNFSDIIGISQMTPGPVAVNTATFVGYKLAGVLGSLSATLGITVVSFILITLVNKIMNKFKESKLWKAALLGMRPVLIALILNAFFSLAKTSYVDIKSIIMALVLGVGLFTKKLNPIVAIGIAAGLGIFVWGGF